MKPRLLVALTLLVLTPLATLAWLGDRLVDRERDAAQHRERELATRSLAEIDRQVSRFVATRERTLGALLEETLHPQGAAATGTVSSRLRAMTRRDPRASCAFELDSRGTWRHPPPGTLDPTERDFLERARQAGLVDQVRHPAPTENGPGGSSYGPAGVLPSTRGVASGPPEPSAILKPGAGPPDPTRPPASSSSGWLVWNWGSGVQLVYWMRQPDDSVVGIELEPIRFLADLVAELPATEPLSSGRPPPETPRVALIDSRDRVAYAWGGRGPLGTAPVAARLSLSPPLSLWRLDMFKDPGASTLPDHGLTRWHLATGLGSLLLALLAVATSLGREVGRDLREASQRVTFVNQVSHELKTPLTNIQLYAELLERDLEESEGPARAHVSVVVSESQRLARLIGNVLTFSRQQRQGLEVRPTPRIPDEVVDRTLATFRPLLESRGLAVERSAAAPDTALLDDDALEQILGNLLGNVEKYAASGGWVRVTSAQEGDQLMIEVHDRGPGIPPGDRERVFEPFLRLDDRLSSGIAGTGIGLTISRELARRHGGDLTVAPSDSGTRMVLTLACPRVVPS